MRRREFIAGLSGVAAMPYAAGAQQTDRVRRVGVLGNGGVNLRDLTTALREGLTKTGWIEGRNLRIDFRDAVNREPDSNRAAAAELVSLAPDVIVTLGVPATRAMQQQTKTIPIVFVNVGDALNNGFVKSIARPEGNATGTTNLFTSLGGKWLELLKEAAPRITNVAVIASRTALTTYADPIEAGATQYAVKVTKTLYNNAAELETAINAVAPESSTGLIVLPNPTRSITELIIGLAVRHRMPAIYPDRNFVAAGGLMSYGPDLRDSYPIAASYVDRILRGAKPSDLPVQFPTKFELVINLKTAKAMGLTISESFLLRADQVIE